MHNSWRRQYDQGEEASREHVMNCVTARMGWVVHSNHVASAAVQHVGCGRLRTRGRRGSIWAVHGWGVQDGTARVWMGSREGDGSVDTTV